MPEEKWMILHPLLFMAVYRANLPAAAPYGLRRLCALAAQAHIAGVA